jgi:hypothetical protein
MLHSRAVWAVSVAAQARVTVRELAQALERVVVAAVPARERVRVVAELKRLSRS